MSETTDIQKLKNRAMYIVADSDMTELLLPRLDALIAQAAQEQLEKDCRAMCPYGCGRGYKVHRDADDSGTWSHTRPPGGRWGSCAAGPIREQDNG